MNEWIKADNGDDAYSAKRLAANSWIKEAT